MGAPRPPATATRPPPLAGRGRAPRAARPAAATHGTPTYTTRARARAREETGRG